MILNGLGASLEKHAPTHVKMGLVGPNSASKRSKTGSKQPKYVSEHPNGLRSFFLENLNFALLQTQVLGPFWGQTTSTTGPKCSPHVAKVHSVPRYHQTPVVQVPRASGPIWGVLEPIDHIYGVQNGPDPSKRHPTRCLGGFRPNKRPPDPTGARPQAPFGTLWRRFGGQIGQCTRWAENAHPLLAP